jgi:thiol-disulfide isomerase/thioredoxin
VFGGYVWIKQDSIERYYNTKFIYYIDHTDKSIIKYDKEKSYIISGNTIGEAIKIYFLNSKRLIKGVSAPTIISNIETEKFKSKDVWKLTYNYDDDGEYINTWKNIWIEKENFKIPRINFSSDFQGENQYNQWDLGNISYDKVTVIELENRLEKLISKYQLTLDEDEEIEEHDSYSEGSILPNISGQTYLENTRVDFQDFYGKLTLLDFWYMDCPPCIKAIPHLNELHRKYSSKGFKVVGVNPFNNNEKDLKRFPRFLSYNSIDYPIVFIDRDKSEEIKIPVFPTFYLVDNKGTILFSQVGYIEENNSKIDSIISANLY